MSYRPKVKYITRSIVPSAAADVNYGTFSIVPSLGAEYCSMLIMCTPDMVARFDRQRGNLSRHKYLKELLDMADGESDFARLEY